MVLYENKCVLGQVGYSEQNTDYTLYLVAGDHKERLQWIHTIRSGTYPPTVT